MQVPHSVGLIAPYKVLSFSYPSDLMKSTVVDESLSSTQLQFCSRENQLATSTNISLNNVLSIRNIKHNFILVSISICSRICVNILIKVWRPHSPYDNICKEELNT